MEIVHSAVSESHQRILLGSKCIIGQGPQGGEWQIRHALPSLPSNVVAKVEFATTIPWGKNVSKEYFFKTESLNGDLQRSIHDCRDGRIGNR